MQGSPSNLDQALSLKDEADAARAAMKYDPREVDLTLAPKSGASQPARRASHRVKTICLGVATAVYLVMAPVGAVGALFAPLVFDRQGNILNPLAWFAFLLMVMFWIACLVGPFLAWVLFRRDKESLAWAAMAAPLAWLTLLVAILQFIPG